MTSAESRSEYYRCSGGEGGKYKTEYIQELWEEVKEA